MSASEFSRNEFSLIIRGDGLDCERLRNDLGLTETRFIHKGEVINKLPRIESKTDVWMYTIRLTERHETDNALNDMLADIEQRVHHLHRLAAKFDVIFRLSVQSEEAQIAFRLMPPTLARLAALGFPLDTSTVSFGDSWL